MEEWYAFYLNESLAPFQKHLQIKLNQYAIEGNDVGFARALSHLGCLQIYEANDFAVQIIHKQIRDEYKEGLLVEADPRIMAGYTRFLALHSVFHGHLDKATDYYREARKFYQGLDFFDDEVLMLIEANYWYYLLIGDWEETHAALARLEQINQWRANLYLQELECLTNSIAIYRECLGRGQKRNIPILGDQRVVFFVSSRLRFLAGLITKDPIPNKVGHHHFIQKIESLYLDLIGTFHRKEWNQAKKILEESQGKIRLWKHPWYEKFILAFGDLCQSEDSKGYTLLANKSKDKSPWEFSLLKDITHEVHRKHNSGKFSFQLFHCFSIQYEDTTPKITGWGRKKAPELLLCLLIQPDQQLPKEQMIELLFQTDDYLKASNHLHVIIHQLNRTFQGIMQNTEDDLKLVQVSHGMIHLEKDRIAAIDLQQYRKLVETGNKEWLKNPEDAVRYYEQAKNIYHPNFLPEYLYIDWLNQYREELKGTFIQLMQKLIQYYKKTGHPPTVCFLFEELIAGDYSEEEHYQKYIAYLLEIREYSGAKHWYGIYKNMMEKEWRAAPTFAYEELAGEI